jgi:hypothetical protein
MSVKGMRLHPWERFDIYMLFSLSHKALRYSAIVFKYAVDYLCKV